MIIEVAYRKLWYRKSSKLFFDMLIGGRNIVNSNVFFAVTNIRTDVQNDSSEFEGLLHKMVSVKY